MKKKSQNITEAKQVIRMRKFAFRFVDVRTVNITVLTE